MGGSAKFIKRSGFEYNRITEMNWEGAPSSLREVYLSDNNIREMNWEGAPSSLTYVNLSDNNIREMNWEGAPSSLKNVNLSDNNITEINWEGAPSSLTNVYLYFGNRITKIIKLKEYISARRIQRGYLRHYTKRKVAAIKITSHCHAWVWKPMCKDGSIGIRPRLDMAALGIEKEERQV